MVVRKFQRENKFSLKLICVHRAQIFLVRYQANLNNSEFENLFNYYPSFPLCNVVGEKNIGPKVAESGIEREVLVELTHYHPRLALTARLNLSLCLNIISFSLKSNGSKDG